MLQLNPSYIFNAKILLCFSAILFCLAISFTFFLVYKYLSPHKENLVFSLIALALGFTIGSTMIVEYSSNRYWYLSGYRGQLMSGFALGALLIHFAAHVTKRRLMTQWGYIALYATSFVLALCTLHPFVLHLPPLHVVSERWDTTAPGSLFFVAPAIPLCEALYAFYLVWRAVKRQGAMQPTSDHSSGASLVYHPLGHHLRFILYGMVCFFVAALMEVIIVIFGPSEGFNFPANPRAVAAVLFCSITAWTLSREVFNSHERSRRIQMENELADRRFKELEDGEHDMKNELGAIEQTLRFLTQEKRIIEEGLRQQLLQMILESAGELYEQFDANLDIARVGQNKSPRLGDLEEFDITQSLQALCAKRQLSCPHHQLHVDSNLTIPRIKTYRAPLLRMANILLDNAIKYSPNGGSIVVRVWEQEQLLHISITDKGIGMAAGEHESVFERFERCRAERLGIPGTGIGLSYVRRVAQEQGGQVWAESEGADKGSTFYLLLPLRSAANGSAPLRHESQSQNSENRGRNITR